MKGQVKSPPESLRPRSPPKATLENSRALVAGFYGDDKRQGLSCITRLSGEVRGTGVMVTHEPPLMSGTRLGW